MGTICAAINFDKKEYFDFGNLATCGKFHSVMHNAEPMALFLSLVRDEWRGDRIGIYEDHETEYETAYDEFKEISADVVRKHGSMEEIARFEAFHAEVAPYCK